MGQYQRLEIILIHKVMGVFMPLWALAVVLNIYVLNREYMYHHYPKFSDKQVWANSVDPDQVALIGSKLFA